MENNSRSKKNTHDKKDEPRDSVGELRSSLFELSSIEDDTTAAAAEESRLWRGNEVMSLDALLEAAATAEATLIEEDRPCR